MAEVGLVPSSMVERLTECGEPAARWVALTALLGLPPGDSRVSQAHADVLADPGTKDLVDRLVPWEVEAPVSGHDKPQFAPNLLLLLADMGVTAGDDPRIAACHEAMLTHQAPDGRFLALQRWRGDSATWAALPCDHHAILETLARAGYADDPRVVAGFRRLADDLVVTPQGRAWKCLPDPVVRFRGPGRVADVCPQVSVEALRALSFVAVGARPSGTEDAVRTLLRVWDRRGTEQPHQFGHGYSFKRVKWPATWYSALTVVDAVGQFPQVWEGHGAALEDRRAVAEMGACLLAYNLDDKGLAMPGSTYTGFGAHSFGQKKRPSEFAAARIAVALRRLDSIAEDVASVDVTALPSSKGGAGTARPPR